MPTFRVLEGPKQRPCVYCKRVVTVGRRHKTNRSLDSDWCPGKFAKGEKEAKADYVKVNRLLSRLVMEGQWSALQAACDAVLRARGEKR